MTKKQKEKQEETRARKAHKEWKRTYKEILADLKNTDWYIAIGLAVSGFQLATVFYYTGYPFTFFTAVGKAVFIEGGVWLMNRAIVWAGVTRVNWVWRGLLWWILATLMLVSVRANYDGEIEKKLQVKYPKQTIVPNSANASLYLDSDERADAWFRGGLIPLLVFASILARRVMTGAANEYQREEMRRFRESERQREYREERKKIVKKLGGGQ